MLGAVDLGLIYGLMALGVYISFRVLDFADLTVDSSFTTGAATTAVMIIHGYNPLLATAMGFVGGFIAGAVTGLLHAKGKITPLLAGILTQISFYSINLRIMGKANLPLLRTETLLSEMRDAKYFGTLISILVFGAVTVAVMLALNWFLTTEIGFAMRATGDNATMARAQSISTDWSIVLGLALSNGLVGLSGALMAQYQGYADIGMGIGLIIAGLASVIIGQAIFGSRHVWVATLAVVAGAIIYRIVIQIALMVGFNPNDMKLISALLVLLALFLPRTAVLASSRAMPKEVADND